MKQPKMKQLLNQLMIMYIIKLIQLFKLITHMLIIILP
eukprot:UN17351